VLVQWGSRPLVPMAHGAMAALMATLPHTKSLHVGSWCFFGMVLQPLYAKVLLWSKTSMAKRQSPSGEDRPEGRVDRNGHMLL
jgi:hypothetical protein